MKSIIIAATLILLLCTHAHAHTLYFTLSDYDDGTIELEGMFSTGTPAAGIKVILYNKKDDAMIWKGKTDEFGICVFQRPSVPYSVELDAGPGHKARQEGI